MCNNNNINVRIYVLRLNIDSISKMRVFINIIIYLIFFEGEPYLWARLDRKPTKQADKRFKKYQYSQKTCKGILFHMLFNLDFCMIELT